MILTILIQWFIIDRLWTHAEDEEHKRAVDELHRAIYDRGFEKGAEATLAEVKARVARFTINIERKDRPAP